MKQLWCFTAGAAALAANCLMAGDPWGRVEAWVVTMVAMVVFMAAIGDAMQHRPAGILIDNRNRVSLSKLQAVAWTVLVLSGLTVMVAAKLKGGSFDFDKNHHPLLILRDPISIDNTLLAVMGISATSLTLTPAILSIKKNALGNSAVFSRDPLANAEWLDIFRGDDSSNADTPDLSKIQQFLVSLIVIVGYGFMLANALGWGVKLVGQAYPALIEFPDMGPDMVWLLGISHAGYLTYKAVPHGSGNDDANSASDPRQTPAG